MKGDRWQVAMKGGVIKVKSNSGGRIAQLCVSSLSEQGDPCLHYLALIIYHITVAVSCSNEDKCSAFEQCLA